MARFGPGRPREVVWREIAARRVSRRRRLSLQLLTDGALTAAAINRFDEIVGSPGTTVRPVPARIASGRRSGFDLFQRKTLFYQIANAVADDRHHIAIFDDVELIADAAVAWNDQGALLAGYDRPGRNGRSNQLL